MDTHLNKRVDPNDPASLTWEDTVVDDMPADVRNWINDGAASPEEQAKRRRDVVEAAYFMHLRHGLTKEVQVFCDEKMADASTNVNNTNAALPAPAQKPQPHLLRLFNASFTGGTTPNNGNVPMTAEAHLIRAHFMSGSMQFLGRGTG